LNGKKKQRGEMPRIQWVGRTGPDWGRPHKNAKKKSYATQILEKQRGQRLWTKQEARKGPKKPIQAPYVPAPSKKFKRKRKAKKKQTSKTAIMG